MKPQEFTNLLDKYLSGTANEQEQQTLINYYDTLQKEELAWDATEMGDQEEVRVSLLTKINNNIEFNEGKVKSKKPQWLAIAASLFIVLGLGSYFLVSSNRKSKNQEQVSIQPGGNKAILTLADGKTIILNEAKNGEIAQQAGIVITKTADGKLVYKVMEAQTNTPEEQFAYNIIKTPRGGQYQVSLPDGTQVWLNAESALKYPTKFATTERVVELEGEGYFEVAKDKSKPFKVITANQKVEVFGTHFNVNAYQDEPTVKTTLLEGSVKVYQLSTQTAQFLKPGQQSVLTTQSFNIQNVDAEAAVDWKNGSFIFNNEDIKTAMRKLARWYDVEVSYEGNFNDIYFGGSFPRYANFNESIKVLESTNKLKCKIEGRRIHIKR